MKTRIILASALTLTLLTGCEHVNHLGVKTKSISISASKSGTSKTSASSGRGPRHCPPGHAKKGEC